MYSKRDCPPIASLAALIVSLSPRPRARHVRAGDHDLVFLETLYLRTVLAVLRRLAARAALGGGCSRRMVRVVLLPLCDGDLSFGTASLLLSLSLGLSYLCEIFLGL